MKSYPNYRVTPWRIKEKSRKKIDSNFHISKIDIGGTVTNIGKRSFQCPEATSLFIGKSVSSIGDFAFANCKKLRSIQVSENNKTYKSIKNGVMTKTHHELVVGGNESKIPDEVVRIGMGAFYGRQMNSITIPGSVKSISNYAFYDCTNLTAVYVLADTPPTLGSQVFGKNADGRRIYVKTECLSAYKYAWPQYKNRIFSIQSPPEYYNIKSAEDWESFRKALDDGTTFEGETVTLENDITVENCMGNTLFKGTFDGKGHTITFNASTSQQPMGLFQYVEDATIQNLKVVGTLTNETNSTASICGRTFGTVNIIGCVSELAITGNACGESTHGGFVALNTGYATLNITNCVFAGKLLGTTDTFNGGFVGYNGGTINFSNCLFKPAEVTMSSMASCTFNSGNQTANYSTCYYTQPLGSPQGNKVEEESELPADIGSLVKSESFGVEIYSNGMKYGGKYYAKPDVSAYSYLDANGNETLSQTTYAVKNNKSTLGSDGNTTWYAVNKSVDLANRITVNGTVNLILTDGTTLNAQKGITVSSGSTLNIYGQASGTGQLIATGDNNAAGIGSGGNINIYGGIITAQGISGVYVTLSYNSANSSITSDSYSGTVTVASGKKFYDAANTSTIVNSGTVTNSSIAGKTLKPVTYTISFDKNAGNAEGEMEAQDMLYSKASNLTANTFSRTGYTFGGWATSANGAVAYTDEQSVKDLASTQGATVTLYAKWTPITYTIHYNKNAEDATGTMADQTFNCDETPVKTISDNAFTLTGKTLSSWNTKSDGTGSSYSPGEPVTKLTVESGPEITLYAQWKKGDLWGSGDGTSEAAAYVISKH